MNTFSFFTARDNAQKHNIISQYTTFEALEKILNNQTLRLTRVDLLNDVVENAKMIDLWKFKVYVACFTHRKDESCFFWDKYTKRSCKGVMITFHTNCLYNLPIHPDEQCLTRALNPCDATNSSINFCADVFYDSWGIYDYSCLDVFYISRQTDVQELDHFQGRIKYVEWNSESETRIRVAIRPRSFEFASEGIKIKYHTPNNKYLYAKLPFGCLETMSITLSPYADDELKKQIDALLMSNRLYGKVKVTASTLFGELQ